MQRRGNLPLIILRFQIPTCKVEFPKVDANQLGNGNSYVLTNQYITQLWHDTILYLLYVVVITAIMLQETAVRPSLRGVASCGRTSR